MRVFLGTIAPAVCITVGIRYSDIYKIFEKYYFENICDIKKIFMGVSQKKD